MSAPTYPLDVEIQLREELDSALVTPAMALLGHDLADQLRDRIDARAQLLTTQLASDDDRLAAETVIDVLGCLWPHGVTDDTWWRTPVGRLCARSLGRDDAEAVTHAVAAAMLGLTRGAIGAMVAKGMLERHPDGGVTRSSVLLRVGRR